MFALDLFNTDHERRIVEGAVDQLEQRRIDDLAMRMDDLVARAKNPAYKKNPAALAALMKEFQKCKAERDNYYMVSNETMGYGGLTGEGQTTPTPTGLRHHARPENYGGYQPEPELKGLNKTLTKNLEKGMGIEFKRAKKFGGGIEVDEGGIPGNVPAEKIPGKEDLLKGRGRSYYEAEQKKNSDQFEGYQDFNKVEPYAVCLAGKPVKKFDYYEEARRFHDNWKKKLYREGDKAKADKITLMPLNLDEAVEDYAGIYSPEAIALGKRFCDHYNITDDGDIQLAVEIIDSYLNEFKATNTPVDLKKIRSGVADAFRQVYRGMGPGPTFRKKFQEQGVAEAEDRVDPILIKALNRMPDGLNSHGQVLNAAYDAYAMELGRMEMKSQYGTTNAYIPQLMNLYKDKYGLDIKEAGNPAQQAAIAVAMKRAGKKPKSVDEGAMSNVHAAMADVYHRLAPKIERHRDSFLAGQLYDELENIAELHGIEPEFKRMMAGARNRAHMDYDTNPGGFQNWFWYLPFDQEELSEEQDTSGVERAILNRIMVAHTDLLMKFGPDKVMQAAEEVAYNVGDVDEIGTSDVSAYVNQVRQILGA